MGLKVGPEQESRTIIIIIIIIIIISIKGTENTVPVIKTSTRNSTDVEVLTRRTVCDWSAPLSFS